MLKVSFLDAEMAWLDTGTFDSLYDASSLIKALQSRSGNLIGSPELTAFENKWITKNKLKTQLNKDKPYEKSLLKSLN